MFSRGGEELAMDYQDLLMDIKEHGSLDKKAFTERIIITKSEVISGAPVSYLEGLAKKLLAEGKQTDDLVFGEYYEIDFLIGLLIVYQKTSPEIKYLLLEEYMRKVDNWALVDMIATRFKVKDFFLGLSKILTYISDCNTYLRRFGYIHFLVNFIKKEEYLTTFLPYIKSDREYIVKMAIAWLIATAFVYHPQLMKDYLMNASLSYDIKKMAVQKMSDSKRIPFDLKIELKEYLKSLPK